MKKILLIALTLMFSFNLKAGAFDDVPVDHWAYDAVEYLAAKGYVIGYPDEEFKGDQQMTRYEWAVMLARLERDLNMRFSAEGGGTPDDVSGLMAMLRSEFDAELAEVRAAIAANELRIDALSGEVMDLWEEVDNLDARMSRIGPGGGSGFNFHYGFEMNEQSAGNNSQNLWGTARMDMAHESGDFMFGLSLQTEGQDNAMKNMFEASLKSWIPLENQLPGTGDPVDWGFDLHEAYMVYNGKSSDHGLDYVVGRFEPFWSQSNLMWNPRSAFEGFVIGGEIQQYRFVTGWMRNTTFSFEDTNFLQLSSDSLVFGVPGTIGWTEDGFDNKAWSLGSNVNLINKDLALNWMWEENGNRDASSFEVMTGVDLLDGWNGKLAWRKVGTGHVGNFGAYRAGVDYWSLGISRMAADDVKMSWIFDTGQTGASPSGSGWQLSWRVEGNF